MELLVENYRGIESAELQLSHRITLVAGENHQGKSSIIQALASALNGHDVPIKGIQKNRAGVLVRSGASEGKVEFKTPNGLRRIEWPACKNWTEGEPAYASDYATGRDDILKHKADEVPVKLTALLQAEPSAEELASALSSAGLAKERVDHTVDLVFGTYDEKGAPIKPPMGWAAACEHSKDTGKKLKGQWEGITAKSYQPAKGQAWLPDGWVDELTSSSKDTLEGEITQAKELLEAAIANNAVSQHEKAKLAELVASKDEHLAAVQEYQAQSKLYEEERKRAEEALRNAPRPDHSAVEHKMACPECKTELVQNEKGQLVKPSGKKITAQEFAEKKAAYEALQKRASEAAALHNNALLSVQLANRMGTAAVEAERQLAELAGLPDGDAQAVETAREQVRQAESRLQCFLKKQRADEIFTSIAKNQKIIDLLAPDGLRQVKLTKTLADFNARLKDLSEGAGSRPVQINNNLVGTLGGREYGLISPSEQFMVDVIIRIAIAEIDQSQFLLIDGADILDRKSFGGLLKLLLQVGIPTVVAATCDEKKDGSFEVPALESFGMGRVYWVCAGKCFPVGQVTSVG